MIVAVQLSEWGKALNAWVDAHDRSIEIVLVRDHFALLESDAVVICIGLGAPWLDTALLARLHRMPAEIIGVYRDDRDEARLTDAGVVHRVSDRLPAEHLAHLIGRLRPAIGNEPSTPTDATWRVGAHRAPLVVGGPPGAGTGEVAIAVAANLSRRASTVIVDANELAAGVAQRLGFPELPNVLRLAAVAAADGDLADMVPAPLRGEFAFDVVPGLPRGVGWSEWTADDASTLIETCRTRWEHNIVTTSPVVEDLRRWGNRFGVSRTLLDGRYPTLGVVEATPRGVVRAADWCSTLGIGTDTAAPVVINKVPRGRAHLGAEVAERLTSVVGEERIEVIGELPLDDRVRRAEWDGVLVERGRFAKAVAGLTDRILDVTSREVIAS